MDEQQFNETTESIREKIGDEQFAIISNEITEFKTGFNQGNSTIENQSKQIEKLKKTNEELVKSNGELFRRIPIGEDKEPDEEKKETKKEPFDFNKMFTKSGNFIK